MLPDASTGRIPAKVVDLRRNSLKEKALRVYS
jgi:hypothetical protein